MEVLIALRLGGKKRQGLGTGYVVCFFLNMNPSRYYQIYLNFLTLSLTQLLTTLKASAIEISSLNSHSQSIRDKPWREKGSERQRDLLVVTSWISGGSEARNHLFHLIIPLLVACPWILWQAKSSNKSDFQKDTKGHSPISHTKCDFPMTVQMQGSSLKP